MQILLTGLIIWHSCQHASSFKCRFLLVFFFQPALSLSQIMQLLQILLLKYSIAIRYIELFDTSSSTVPIGSPCDGSNQRSCDRCHSTLRPRTHTFSFLNPQYFLLSSPTRKLIDRLALCLNLIQKAYRTTPRITMGYFLKAPFRRKDRLS